MRENVRVSYDSLADSRVSRINVANTSLSVSFPWLITHETLLIPNHREAHTSKYDVSMSTLKHEAFELFLSTLNSTIFGEEEKNEN